MNRAPRSAAHRGFTLVEVLVALVIMAVLASMAWQGIDGIARSRTIADERLEQTLRLNAVLAQWQQDLQMLHDGTAVPTLRFDGANVLMVRDAEGGVQLVAWSLRAGQWTRWAGPPVVRAGDLQEQWIRSQQLMGNEPGTVRTIGGAAAWRIFFYRGNAWTNAQSSGDEAPAMEGAPAKPAASRREALPNGVRLMLTLPQGVLVRDVMLGPQS
jgi:general secretion pathway protein J